MPAPHWGNYVKGAAFYAAAKHAGRLRRGFDFLVDSSIPPSGGASSSSALIPLAGMILVLPLVRNTRATDEGRVKRI